MCFSLCMRCPRVKTTSPHTLSACAASTVLVLLEHLPPPPLPSPSPRPPPAWTHYRGYWASGLPHCFPCWSFLMPLLCLTDFALWKVLSPALTPLLFAVSTSHTTPLAVSTLCPTPCPSRSSPSLSAPPQVAVQRRSSPCWLDPGRGRAVCHLWPAIPGHGLGGLVQGG